MTGQAGNGQSPKKACGGTAAVEFILILPLLLAVFALVFDGGRMLADYHAVSKSVRAAARFLARTETGAAGCTPRKLDNAQPNVARAIRLAMTGRIDGDIASDNLIGAWRAGDLSEAATGIRVSIDCLNNVGAVAIPMITLRARVPFHFGPARALGLGPDFSFSVAHKSVVTGV